MADSQGKTILHINFADIVDQPLSLNGATKHKFRFIDGDALAHKSSIHVLEFEHLPSAPYAVISYVWRGLPPLPNDKPTLPKITVKGAEGADPISVEVLKIVSLAAERQGCKLVWLDALCILQDNDDDKAWQIQRMYDIYRSSTDCIVAPGGLQRLVSLTEETTWASRAWTLQEAIAPPSVHCLFAWDRGDCCFQSNFPLPVKQLEGARAGVAPLKTALETAMKGRGVSLYDMQGEKMDLPSEDYRILLFGDAGRDRPRIRELIDAMDMKGKKGMYTAIWRSSFMRAAKYPVDAVFSIMGIMGVTLDTSKFGNEDRLGATIALMKAILGRGGQAEWLGIATRALPNPRLSTLPVFPEVDAARRPILETRDGMKDIADVMDTGWRLEGTPGGVMESDGYFRFGALSTSVRQTEEEGESARVFRSETCGNWEVVDKDEGSHVAVLIGKWEQYNNGAFGVLRNPWDQALMMLEEGGGGRFSNVGYAFVKEEVVRTGNWEETVVVVGGPN
ncbi:hypothetical protein CCMA1212_009826 [Trichoderma ghanense]|uniref:Heterokaryon incompatibility domain-containing protein n=1 Tax=Trichoderma ghanense TaxID=65468 RepID=A0ABY2GT60_9HYPO